MRLLILFITFISMSSALHASQPFYCMADDKKTTFNIATYFGISPQHVLEFDLNAKINGESFTYEREQGDSVYSKSSAAGTTIYIKRKDNLIITIEITYNYDIAYTRFENNSDIKYTFIYGPQSDAAVTIKGKASCDFKQTE